MKFSNKLLSLLLCAVMVLGSVAVGGEEFAQVLDAFSVKASAASSGIYTYNITNSKATITDCSTGASGEIIIPSTLGGYPVTSIGYDAFDGCTGLTSVTIPDSVTSIGAGAFDKCQNIYYAGSEEEATTIGLQYSNCFIHYYCSNRDYLNDPIVYMKKAAPTAMNNTYYEWDLVDFTDNGFKHETKYSYIVDEGSSIATSGNFVSPTGHQFKINGLSFDNDCHIEGIPHLTNSNEQECIHLNIFIKFYDETGNVIAESISNSSWPETLIFIIPEQNPVEIGKNINYKIGDMLTEKTENKWYCFVAANYKTEMEMKEYIKEMHSDPSLIGPVTHEIYIYYSYSFAVFDKNGISVPLYAEEAGGGGTDKYGSYSWGPQLFNTIPGEKYYVRVSCEKYYWFDINIGTPQERANDITESMNVLVDSSNDASVYFDNEANIPEDTQFNFEVIETTDTTQTFNLDLISNGKTIEPETPVWVKIPIPSQWTPRSSNGWYQDEIIVRHEDEILESFILDNYIWFCTTHFSEFDLVLNHDIEETNSTANAKLNVAGAQTINFRSIVTITATAIDVPEGYKLAIYLGSQKVAEGDNNSVSYEYGELKSDLNYSVKVIDANGKVQKDSSGNDVAKDGGKITCNAGFFKKLIAFFKGLFKFLPKVEVKP